MDAHWDFIPSVFQKKCGIFQPRLEVIEGKQQALSLGRQLDNFQFTEHAGIVQHAVL